ncbi:MAG: TVP38/TMEM64 family protein, partial [Planctomyces sp.]
QRKVTAFGPWGPIIFGVAYFLAAVLFVPGSALTLAAGAIFGIPGGFATVSIASTAAAGTSFLIARYLARDKVRALADSNRTFGAIDRAIAQGGWRIIALLRLSPAVPFSLGNYLYGLTPVKFWPYVIASWIAMMPGSFLYVYLGFVGRTAAGAASSA